MTFTRLMPCPTCWGNRRECQRCAGRGEIPDFQIGENFRLSELLVSPTARSLNIPNAPTEAEEVNLINLVTLLLQPLRQAARVPLRVTSAFRSEDLNKAVKGSTTSAHRVGHAVDVIPIGMAVPELMAVLVRSGIPFDQAIDEGHCHIGRLSPSGAQRRQVLKKMGPGHYIPHPDVRS